MRVTFLGGAEEIGASCAVLDLEGVRLLVDCGQRLSAGAGKALPDFSLLEHGPPLTAILLTHAHADHIGALPALEPFLPPGCPIYGTETTLALARVMLDDSVRIMMHYRQNDGDLPLFSPRALQGTFERFQAIRWNKAEKLSPHVQATWYPAGHILGAAMISIEGREGSILFSGDVSVADQVSVAGVYVPSLRPNMLVLESTYGNRLHAHRPAQEQRIIERVRHCCSEGGHVLFPTFALGRAQEVLLLLSRAMHDRKLDPIPVYADGLVRAISKVYVRFPDDLSPECRRLWEQYYDPIFPDDLPIRAVRDNHQREQIAAGKACVVVSSSGMLQGGASQFYARQWVHDPRNLIMITGYQDEESPGQALLNLASLPPDQPRYFKMGGILTEISCQVESCWLSAHADNGELLSLATKLQPQQVFLVHGDAEARDGLARTLMANCRAQVVLPANGESYALETESAERRPHFARATPLSLWPPWDPMTPRPLDLQLFHRWLASLTPKVSWITLDELAELWKSPGPVTAEDWSVLRRAVYEQPQPYLIPDSKRTYILHVSPLENLQLAQVINRVRVEQAATSLREYFPAESGLKRHGFYPDEGVVELTFEFPRAADTHYVRRFAQFSERTGWTVRLTRATEESSLTGLLRQWLPAADGSAMEVLHDPPAVRVHFDGSLESSELDELPERFQHKTGYRLEVVPPQPTESPGSASITAL